MYKLHQRCRACGYGPALTPPGIKAEKNGENLIPVLDLGLQPLANDFQDENGTSAGFAPLKVLYCPRCTLAQLSVVVEPELLYGNYAFRTSRSQTIRDHMEAVLQKAAKDMGHWPERVLEIGSNDGYMLLLAKGRGSKVAGLDLAPNRVDEALELGIPSWCGTLNDYTLEWAEQQLGGSPDLILARHVLCHIDNWQGLMPPLKRAVWAGAMVIVETPSVGSLFENGLWDTIYHEHLSYLTIVAAHYLFHGAGLTLRDCVHVPEIHGGVNLFTVTASGPSIPAARGIAVEMPGLDCWERLNTVMLSEIAKLDEVVNGDVVGYGAPAKATVRLNTVGLGRNRIRWVCDDTPQKQYKLIPGTDIPVVDEGAMTRELPKMAILFAWNYAKEIMAKNKAFTDAGGQWVLSNGKVV